MNLRKPIIYSVMVAFLLSGVALMATTTKPQPRKPIATPQPVEFTSENAEPETVNESDLPAIAPQTTPEPTRRPVTRPMTQTKAEGGTKVVAVVEVNTASQAGGGEASDSPTPTPEPRNHSTVTTTVCVDADGKPVRCPNLNKTICQDTPTSVCVSN